MQTATVSGRWGWIGADAPGPGRRVSPPWRAYALAGGTVVGVTALAFALGGRASESDLVLAYMLGTLPVALRGDRGAAVAAAVLSVIAFDLFFVPPYYTLAVSDLRSLFTFLGMGLVGGTVASLTARLASEIVEMRRSERRARALHELSRSLLAAGLPAEVLTSGASVLRREIGLPVAAWLTGTDGQLEPVVPPDVPLTPSQTETLRAVMRDGLPAGPGTGRLPGAAWLFVPVATGVLGAPLGPTDTDDVAAVRAALETGANQIAIALGRSLAREEADAARRQADAERVRNSLLSAMSHDLRTPLTGIVGAAATLAESSEALTPATRRELAQGIVEEGDRLTRLIANLLQATRLEQGGVTLQRAWVPLEEIVAPVLASQAAALAGRDVRVDLPASLPLAWVDPMLIGQVFANLLENATRYTPAGSPVTIRAEQLGETLHVEVTDAGPGISAGDENAIFARFRRDTNSRGDGGVGLGLAIARGVVEAHGGTISVSRAAEGGAAFRFTLPAPPP